MLFRSKDTATTEIYTTEDTLSLHDALPISLVCLKPEHAARGMKAKLRVTRRHPR